MFNPNARTDFILVGADTNAISPFTEPATYEMTYNLTIKNVDATVTSVEVWMPLPVANCDTIKCAETGITRTKIAKDLHLASRDDPLLIRALSELLRDFQIELHAYRYTFPWLDKKD